MKWLGILMLLIAAVVVFWVTAYPSVTVRYRLTLEALVDGELKTASSVREVTYGKQSGFASGHELFIRYRGEAIALDLGSRGTLFALLTKDADDRSRAEWIVLHAFGFNGGSLPRPVEEGLKQVSRLSGKRELPLDGLPMLVRFRDLADPTTVERISPLNIEERFGPDAKLIRATLEIVPAGIWPLNSVGITGEPITTGILERLPWLKRLNGGYLDGAFAGGGPALSNVLFGGNFKTGAE
ncbi:hypothetical protein [Bradyrhizobium sp. AUGA SZCCT0182]|uniref:hypothetical protein n=1 Tax=Bradyrhizobium sp. AUGA SZCCT0182 TaxID=2807667 RepID=UPI001BA712A1|nr:hypothetical protein [Bradyrhizobium sp. AUGA SZCCT0182]MBR1230893.1 hypothetical protein [Bradyrhizobium sp. AUGA SZCCT0182]